MEKLRKLKEERLSEIDLKPTGRQIFEMKSKGLADFTLEIEDEEEDTEEAKEEGEESEEDEDEGVTIYDKNLFA